jgi:hypothetical protein
MLCKTAVARRVLSRAWQAGLPLDSCEIRGIDALRHFGARVEACLLVCRSTKGDDSSCDCRTFDQLKDRRNKRTFGWRDGRLVADVDAYRRLGHLLGGDSPARWRSGVKHDCAAVFEFREHENGKLQNGLGETVDVEDDYLFPLMKSSDVAGSEVANLQRSVLVPQRRVGEETDSIARRAPKTWRYLQQHAERLDRRASRVYRGQPRFSIFGVGPYTFARWKVVVSGFYKTPQFAAVGPVGGRPVVCDDTCYFLRCASPDEARTLAELLNGTLAREFFDAFIFPDAKRPLTADLLSALNLESLKKSGT